MDSERLFGSSLARAAVIARVVREELAIPVVEIEVPPRAAPIMPTLRAKLEALVETVMERRKP